MSPLDRLLKGRWQECSKRRVTQALVKQGKCDEIALVGRYL
jgi:hypothetical protein